MSDRIDREILDSMPGRLRELLAYFAGLRKDEEHPALYTGRAFSSISSPGEYVEAVDDSVLDSLARDAAEVESPDNIGAVLASILFAARISAAGKEKPDVSRDRVEHRALVMALPAMARVYFQAALHWRGHHYPIHNFHGLTNLVAGALGHQDLDEFIGWLGREHLAEGYYDYGTPDRRVAAILSMMRTEEWFFDHNLWEALKVEVPKAIAEEEAKHARWEAEEAESAKAEGKEVAQ
jgi:hypothetical protein